jgi:hypothetical protein
MKQLSKTFYLEKMQTPKNKTDGMSTEDCLLWNLE